MCVLGLGWCSCLRSSWWHTEVIERGAFAYSNVQHRSLSSTTIQNITHTMYVLLCVGTYTIHMSHNRIPSARDHWRVLQR